MPDIETIRRDVLLAHEAERRTRRERIVPILEELVRAGWSQEHVLIIEPLIQRMHDSLTADDLRTLAALPSWPTDIPYRSL